MKGVRLADKSVDEGLAYLEDIHGVLNSTEHAEYHKQLREKIGELQLLGRTGERRLGAKDAQLVERLINRGRSCFERRAWSALLARRRKARSRHRAKVRHTSVNDRNHSEKKKESLSLHSSVMQQLRDIQEAEGYGSAEVTVMHLMELYEMAASDRKGPTARSMKSCNTDLDALATDYDDLDALVTEDDDLDDWSDDF